MTLAAKIAWRPAWAERAVDEWSLDIGRVFPSGDWGLSSSSTPFAALAGWAPLQ
jgi:hypothetical protein